MPTPTVQRNTLLELIGRYWDIAYAEGAQHRAQDTPAGDAQQALQAIQNAVTQLQTAEREACAQALNLSAADLRLMAGEMTAQEVRTTRAVLTQRATHLRNGWHLPSSAHQEANHG